jgi:hypothetical protein
MQTVTTIGLDIAKSVFQVPGTDAEGKVLIRRKLKRGYVIAFFEKLPPCLVGVEACATSHHWSREFPTAEAEQAKTWISAAADCNLAISCHFATERT